MEPIAHWSFGEGTGHVTTDRVTGRPDPIEFALLKGRFQPPQDPVWRTGVKGSALLFDGYSTYIRRPNLLVKQPVKGLTIRAWIAPSIHEYGDENKLAPIINQHNRDAGQGYILGLFRHGAWSFQLGLDNEWVEVWCYDHPIALQVWSHVTATYEASSGALRLFLNGEEVAVHLHTKPAEITPTKEDLLVGRNNHAHVIAESFYMNMFNGLMDELEVLDYVISPSAVKEQYEAFLKIIGSKVPPIEVKDFTIPRELFNGDRHRPQFHMNPPGHWMNEPHAPIYYNGQYHLFYQSNPRGPFWHQIHWGHWVSEDLIHWRDLPPALSPEAGLDPDGIWSGSACLDEHGYPALFYTAGNDMRTPNQAVGLARSTFPQDGDLDLTRWMKHPEPIVVQEKGMGLFGEFRDPFVWKEENTWYMLVGSGTGTGMGVGPKATVSAVTQVSADSEEKGGTALLYTSTDMMNWSYKGPLFISDYEHYPYLGVVWELPVLLPLNCGGQPSGKHIFLISPWGKQSTVEVNYWIGTWDRDQFTFIPDHKEPRLMDVGDFHFTGPSGMVDPQTGRTLLFTIAQGERTPEIDYDCGWSHCAGMPVSLFLREDGRLGFEPIEEIRGLRSKSLLKIEEKSLDAVNEMLTTIHGDMLEILVEFEAITATRYGLSVKRSPNGEEETALYYDHHSGMLGVNREKSNMDPMERPNGIQEGSLELDGERLRLHILIDRSLIEVYANSLKSLTTRAYPTSLTADGLQLWANGEIRITSMSVWEMNPAFDLDYRRSDRKVTNR